MKFFDFRLVVVYNLSGLQSIIFIHIDKLMTLEDLLRTFQQSHVLTAQHTSFSGIETCETRVKTAFLLIERVCFVIWYAMPFISCLTTGWYHWVNCKEQQEGSSFNAYSKKMHLHIITCHGHRQNVYKFH